LRRRYPRTLYRIFRLAPEQDIAWAVNKETGMIPARLPLSNILALFKVMDVTGHTGEG